MSKIKRCAAAVVVAGGLLSVADVVSPTPAAAIVCGQYTTKNDVYYGHCGSTSVKVRITYYPYYQPLPDVVCLAPGEHYIGPKAYVSRVRSDGKEC